MIKTIGKFIGILLLTVALAIIVYVADKNGCDVVVILLSAVIGWLVEQLLFSVQDIADISSWKKEQRKCSRGHFINKDTLIRISFAYIFRIKVDGKYLLVMNKRNTGKYQPVGGVYKMLDSEKRYLASKYGCMDDDMIPIDASSKNDYRLRVKERYLRAFVRRFNKGIDREIIDNLSREFKEELIDTGIFSPENFKKIQYEYVGRYYNGVKFTQKFGYYELLLGDVVSLIPTPEQEKELRELLNDGSKTEVSFFTDEQINKYGVGAVHGELKEIIADHTINVIESQKDNLEGSYKKGKVYEAELEEVQ